MVNPAGKDSGIIRIVRALGFSLDGLVATFRSEAAFRQEVALFVIAVPAAAWLAETVFQFSIMLASILLVMAIELLNTAIESLVDRFSPDQNEYYRNAKDMGSAAVLISLVIVAVVWLPPVVGKLA